MQNTLMALYVKYGDIDGSKTGFSQDMFVQNTSMDLYFKCGDTVRWK